MRISISGIVVFLMFAQCVQAGSEWIFRIETKDLQIGTGFVIATDDETRAILLTNEHVLRSADAPIIIDGREIPKSSLIGASADADVAALLIPWNGKRGYLSDDHPTVGMEVDFYGMSSGRKSGRIVSVGMNDGPGIDWISPRTELAWSDFAVTGGDSGAPMIGPDGRVIGITSVATKEGSRDVPPAGATTVRHIKACLLKWGWRCLHGRCSRIEIPPPRPIPEPEQPPAPRITPQLPPIDWRPLPSEDSHFQRNPIDQNSDQSRILDTSEKEWIQNPYTSLDGKKIEQPKPNDESKDGLFSRLPWGMILVGAASAAGVGIPTWAIMAWRGARAVRRIREGRGERVVSDRPDRTIVVDGPPGRDRIFENTKFLNVESDHHRNAYDWAKGRTVYRYPGAQEIFEANDSLIGQYLTGFPKEK